MRGKLAGGHASVWRRSSGSLGQQSLSSYPILATSCSGPTATRAQSCVERPVTTGRWWVSSLNPRCRTDSLRWRKPVSTAWGLVLTSPTLSINGAATADPIEQSSRWQQRSDGFGLASCRRASVSWSLLCGDEATWRPSSCSAEWVPWGRCPSRCSFRGRRRFGWTPYCHVSSWRSLRGRRDACFGHRARCACGGHGRAGFRSSCSFWRFAGGGGSSSRVFGRVGSSSRSYPSSGLHKGVGVHECRRADCFLPPCPTRPFGAETKGQGEGRREGKKTRGRGSGAHRKPCQDDAFGGGSVGCDSGRTEEDARVHGRPKKRQCRLVLLRLLSLCLSRVVPR